MTNPVLDDNLRRLFHRCTPRLSEDDLDRAFARFEGRRRPAPALSRALPALAAVLVLGLLGWLVVSSPPRTATPGAQETPEDIALLIKDLGSASPEVREKAKTRLLGMGSAALAPLDRALYHEDPEVRIQSQDLAKIVRRRTEIQGSLAFVRAAVKIVRARWVARDFTDFPKAIDDAFDPELPSWSHYVPRKTVESVFDIARTRDDARNLRLQTIRGVNDHLTAAMVAALEKADGILFLDVNGEPTDLSEVCVFTLPDKVGWSAYVIVSLPELAGPNFEERIYVCERNEAAKFLLSVRLTPQPGGGVRIDDVIPDQATMAKAFKKGDILRILNGAPLNSVRDFRQVVDPPPGTMMITVDRNGKVFSIQIRLLEKIVVRRTGPKAEADAEKRFEEAEKAFSEDPSRAWDLYQQLLSEYETTDFVSKGKKPFIEERVVALKAKLKRDK